MRSSIVRTSGTDKTPKYSQTVHDSEDQVERQFVTLEIETPNSDESHESAVRSSNGLCASRYLETIAFLKDIGNFF